MTTTPQSDLSANTYISFHGEMEEFMRLTFNPPEGGTHVSMDIDKAAAVAEKHFPVEPDENGLYETEPVAALAMAIVTAYAAGRAEVRRIDPPKAGAPADG